MESIMVKLATENDLEEVSRLFAFLNTDHYCFSDKEEINNYIHQKKCYIAILDKKIIGAIVLTCEEQNCEINILRSEQK
jgi:hypothetical protein